MRFLLVSILKQICKIDDPRISNIMEAEENNEKFSKIKYPRISTQIEEDFNNVNGMNSIRNKKIYDDYPVTQPKTLIKFPNYDFGDLYFDHLLDMLIKHPTSLASLEIKNLKQKDKASKKQAIANQESLRLKNQDTQEPIINQASVSSTMAQNNQITQQKDTSKSVRFGEETSMHVGGHQQKESHQLPCIQMSQMSTIMPQIQFQPEIHIPPSQPILSMLSIPTQIQTQPQSLLSRQFEEVKQSFSETPNIYQGMIKLNQKLKVKDCLSHEPTRTIYLGIMKNKKLERNQANSEQLITQMFDDCFMCFCNAMKEHPHEIQMRLAVIFCEEHLDFLVSSSRGQLRKQFQNDKLIFSVVMILKLLKAYNVQGRILFQVMVSMLISRLDFLFDDERDFQPKNFIQFQKYFHQGFYENAPVPLEVNEDNNMLCLSMIRKFSLFLWGLLWVDPQYFLTNEMLRLRAYKYSEDDLKQDRSCFAELIKSFIQKTKRSLSFLALPSVSSLWDVLSYSIYGNQMMSQENLLLHKSILKYICQTCEPLTQISRQVDSNSLSMAVQEYKQRNPHVHPNIIKLMNAELFDKCFNNQKGVVEIVRFKILIAIGTIKSDHEDYRDYDFHKVQFEIDTRDRYYS